MTPPTPTGFSRPTGVSLPVRPTWMSIASSVVSAFSAGNLCASAPARRAGDLAEPLLPVEPVDLVDDAVDVERQIGARLLDRAIMGEHRVEVVAADEQVGDRDAEALDPLHRLELRVGRAARETSPQPWARKRSGRAAVTAGVLLPERAGGGVARVGEDLAAGRFLPLVQRLEVGLGHVDLAAHLEARPAAAAFGNAAAGNVGRSSATLAVTSSPVAPSPRVAASTSAPFS